MITRRICDKNMLMLVKQGPEHDSHGNKTRLLKSLNAWGASSKADAAAKAKRISKANKKKNN